MSRVIPIVIAVIAIAALTVVEGIMSERWGDNRLGAYCVTLLDDFPKEIGTWTGIDSEVDAMTQEVAGARGYVSRSYRDSESNKAVGVWLIVGHSRDTADHVPTTCYTGNGFRYGNSKAKYTLTLKDGSQVHFFTALFEKDGPLGVLKERVYWTWFKPNANSGEPVEWIAPDNLRLEVGAAPALYKLYLTTGGAAAEADLDKSDCLDFAQDFFPVVNAALRSANGEIPDDFDPSTVAGI